MTELINPPGRAEGGSLPRFTAAERTFIKLKLFEGLTASEILPSFKNFFYPGNNYPGSPLKIKAWQGRVGQTVKLMDKSKEYKDLLYQAKTGLGKKEHRLHVRKKLIAKSINLLADYDGKKYSEMDTDQQNGVINLNSLLLKHLKDLAIELGDYKTTSINVDQRKQLQIVQQQNVFGGQATVPHLQGDDSTGLRIVAPSVEQRSREQVPGELPGEIDPTAVGDSSLSPDASPAMPDASKEVEQPPDEE